MKILLTGASSFSGYWIAEKLHRAGASVVAPLRGTVNGYDGVRGERVRKLAAIAEIVPGCSFGDQAFLEVIGGRSFDVLCHHAACVADYRSLDFDVVGALAENTREIRKVLQTMLERGLRAVIATGSVFEQDEGAGNNPPRAFSPYGLSKGLTWQVIRHWCTHLGLNLGKFVIANPFGPLEEPRFGAYLVNSWRKGLVAEVRTPRYLRDNIPVDLLALAYAGFVQTTLNGSGKLGPSYYVETQGAFAERFACAMQGRLNMKCEVKLLTQTDFSEPLARINTDTVDGAAFGWDEEAAWDRVAEYYLG